MFTNQELISTITQKLVIIPGILIGFTFHEYAHAYMATKFGDPTPGRQGRLTTNPLAHIDLWGFLLILIAGFGWAKPVQTNPSYYKGNVRNKDIAVSIVGPLTNLLIALVFTVILKIMLSANFLSYDRGQSVTIIRLIVLRIISINCVLFVFNLIPIPPLDGFHILSDLLPPSAYNFISFIERYGYIILMVFIISPLSDAIISTSAGFILNLIFTMAGLK